MDVFLFIFQGNDCMVFLKYGQDMGTHPNSGMFACNNKTNLVQLGAGTH